MIRKLALVLTLISGLVAGIVPALAQNPNFPNNVAGQFVASEYGKWNITTLTAMTANTASTINFYPCYQKVGTGNRQVFPWQQSGAQALNVPIQILDGSLSETITTESAVSLPAAATASYPQPFICSITVTPVNAHAAGVSIVSGDGGLAEAMNDAISSGGSAVVLDSTFGTYSPSSALVYPAVQIVDLRSPTVEFWNPVQTSASFFAAPTTLTTTTVGFGLNGANTTGGAYVGANTYHVCVAYVDVFGQEGPCSADFSGLTAGTGSTNQIGIAAPAAATGAVGYTVYISLTGGTYALSYQAPLTSTTCTLTKVETVTPACALTNTAYGQTGSNAVISALTVNTSPIATQLGGVNNQLGTGNSNGRQGYGYAISTHSSLGFPSVNLAYTITAGAVASTNPIVLGTVNIPAGFLNQVGRTIRVCGKVKQTIANSPTIENLQLYWDGAGSDTAGSPVQLANLSGTATYTNVAYNEAFCENFTTTVSGAGVTAGSIIGGFNVASSGIASAPTNLITMLDTLNSAVASLNLAGGAGFTSRLHVVANHTTGADGTAQLLNLTVELVN